MENKEQKNTKIKSYLTDIIVILIIVLAACMLIYIITVPIRGKEVYRYKSTDDIEILHSAKSNVAKIEVVDEYKKNDINYVEFKTSITGDKIFTFSQEEYETKVGTNDAIDCEIYTLELNSNIITTMPRLTKDLSSFKKIHLQEGMRKSNDFEKTPDEEIPYDLYSSVIASVKEMKSDWNIFIRNTDKQADIFVYNNLGANTFDNQCLSSCYRKIRYSFLDECDFTENEIVQFQEEMQSANLYVLQVYDEYN